MSTYKHLNELNNINQECTELENLSTEVKRATHNRDRVVLFGKLEQQQNSLKNKLEHFVQNHSSVTHLVANANKSQVGKTLYDEVI